MSNSASKLAFQKAGRRHLGLRYVKWLLYCSTTKVVLCLDKEATI